MTEDQLKWASHGVTRLEPELGRISPTRRRVFGSYYTPEKVALILARWALDGRLGRILDPSFGGCAFLEAGRQALQEVGVPQPGELVFGVDIDQGCLDSVRESEALKTGNIIIGDFLQLSPHDVPGTPFRAVVGNPPFIRHHWINGESRSAAREIARRSGVRLPATASSWAYFVVHSLDFLALGGRLAMLVPEAVLQADYSIPLRKHLTSRFRRVRLIQIRSRLFRDTDEPVVVIAAEGFGSHGELTVETVESSRDLFSVLQDVPNHLEKSQVTTPLGRNLDPGAHSLFSGILNHESIRPMADSSAIKIGLVTGANDYFIGKPSDLDALSIDHCDRIPIIARTQWLTGLSVTEDDHRLLAEQDKPCFLIRPSTPGQLGSGLHRWIREGERTGIPERSHCKRRKTWYGIELPTRPHAFATCSRSGPPKLIINHSGLHCTNALHTVYWKTESPTAPKAFAVGFLTTLVALWAELNGRRYGGGVLKIEPGTLARAPIPIIPSAASSFDQIDELTRNGQEDEARNLADHVVLHQGLGLCDRDIRLLRKAVHTLREQRIPVRGNRS